MWHVLFLLVLLIIDKSTSLAKNRFIESKIGSIQQYIQQIENGVVLIDGDNVRGKSRFRLTKEGTVNMKAFVLYFC